MRESWDETYQLVTRADQIDIATVAAYCELREGGPPRSSQRPPTEEGTFNMSEFQ